MYHKTACFLPIFFLFIFFSVNALAEEMGEDELCSIENRNCILKQITKSSDLIGNMSWRDQTYREVAKTYASDGEFIAAIAIIEKIKTPDTKAMAIRGIGMALAPQGYKQKELDTMFTTLRMEADKIVHPASYAIALTYIAMAQAFAGDNKGAWKTASDMENDALRHKAYGETAEIQAEKSDFISARTSIEKIESLAYRNKAYATISKILSDNGLFNDAYKAAQIITNPYKKALALQYMLDAQKPRDVKH